MPIKKIFPFPFFIFLLINLMCSELRSQDTLNSYEVDQKSYSLYDQKKWKDLVTFTDEAIGQKFDYYYLRMRAGIANYELGNYIKAQSHFEKALLFNTGDELILEYIYYCYIFTSRFEEARKYSLKFTEALASKLNTVNQTKFAYAIIEGGAKMTDSTRILGQGNYFHAGISHYVNNKFSLYHAVTYFGQSFSDGLALTGQANQFQYYLGAIIPLKNNCRVLPSLHFLNKNVILHIPGTPAKTFPPGQGPKGPTYRDSTIKDNYMVASFAVSKRIEQFDFSLNSTYSSVFGSTQLQHGISVSYLPWMAKKIVLGFNGYLHTEDSYSSSNITVIPFLVYKPFQKLSIGASYLMNTGGDNAVEMNGYIVNNSADITKSRLSFSASYNVYKQFDVYGLFQYEEKNESTKDYIYHYNLVVLGIKIRAKH